MDNAKFGDPNKGSSKEEEVVKSQLEDPCPVCYAEISLATKAVADPCMHIFHESCIMQSMNRSIACPVCRSNIDRLQLRFTDEEQFETMEIEDVFTQEDLEEMDEEFEAAVAAMLHDVARRGLER